MTKDQKIVATGAFCGAVSMLLCMTLMYNFWPMPAGFLNVIDRLAFTIRADAIAALPLLAGIIVVGNKRFASEAIDPTRHRETMAMVIDGKFVDNTLQQFAMFLIGTLALSVNLEPRQMSIIPAAVVVFVCSRVAFWIGYRINPLYRAFGMAATGYLNLGILGYVAFDMVKSAL